HLRGQTIALGLERRHRHAQVIALGRERLQPCRCTRGLRRLLRPHPLELVLPLREPVDQSLLPRPRRLQPPLQRLLEVYPRRPRQAAPFDFESSRGRPQLIALRGERLQALPDGGRLRGVLREQRVDCVRALLELGAQRLRARPRFPERTGELVALAARRALLCPEALELAARLRPLFVCLLGPRPCVSALTPRRRDPPARGLADGRGPAQRFPC